MMDSNCKTLQSIQENRLVAIVRNIDPKDIVDVAKALYDGGVRLMEITFNQSSDNCIEMTTQSIRLVKAVLPDQIIVGAGTVMTTFQLIKAYEAGAEFILSPNVDQRIIELTKELGLVSVPGAFSPTEIATAYGYGADIVKLFPAGSLEPGYVKNVTAPVNHIPLMLVGGINEQNMAEYLKIGKMSFGLGSNILRKADIEAHNYSAITELAKKYVRMVRDN